MRRRAPRGPARRSRGSWSGAGRGARERAAPTRTPRPSRRSRDGRPRRPRARTRPPRGRRAGRSPWPAPPRRARRRRAPPWFPRRRRPSAPGPARPRDGPAATRSPPPRPPAAPSAFRGTCRGPPGCASGRCYDSAPDVSRSSTGGRAGQAGRKRRREPVEGRTDRDRACRTPAPGPHDPVRPGRQLGASQRVSRLVEPRRHGTHGRPGHGRGTRVARRPRRGDRRVSGFARVRGRVHGRRAERVPRQQPQRSALSGGAHDVGARGRGHPGLRGTRSPTTSGATGGSRGSWERSPPDTWCNLASWNGGSTARTSERPRVSARSPSTGPSS